MFHPTQDHGLGAVCVSSPSTSYRDSWWMERSSIAAVSGKSTVDKVAALFFFLCWCVDPDLSRSRTWWRLTAFHA